MKKEQQKKTKKGGPKKKDDKASDSKTEEAEAAEAIQPAEDETAVDTQAEAPEEGSRPPAARQPSISEQSRQRSESFRHGTTVPTSPAAGDVQDLYRKQAARIEELERENLAFKQQQDESAARLAKAEDELETFREGSSQLAELRSKSQDVERLETELANTQRQLAQAQQSSKSHTRRASGVTPDVTEQLANKTSTIESLELEISNLHNQISGLQNTVSEREASIQEVQDRASTAETATKTAQQELDALKVSISFPSDETKAANEDPEALTKRITVLESDLRSANTNLDAAAKRATGLEAKIEALTKLHRDANTTSQAKDRELTELRAQLRRRDRASNVRDVSDFELGEEETETGSLHARIRALEAENFDLRRNEWREKRAELQPEMEEHNGHAGLYEDVDLNSPYGGSRKGSAPRQQAHSTFQDVITSGISAFTGRAREAAAASARGYPPRKQSLALLSEDGDDEFDPEAFQLAQEEEAKRRIERVKEVKRGLEKWRGWRMDLTEARQNAVAAGREYAPVFGV